MLRQASLNISKNLATQCVVWLQDNEVLNE